LLTVLLLINSLFTIPSQNTNLILVNCTSLANLRYNAEVENSTYEKSLITISETSKFITIYELITILLIIGAGLCGISEIAKNKLLGYSGFAVGGVGVTILLLLILEPTVIVGSQGMFH
jgi:hypothetical protein